ncbi:MAG: VWA domain-containing protein [Anaerolineales bacterium]
MKKIINFSLVALSALSLLAGLAFSPAAQQDVQVRVTQIDTSQFPSVTFYVSVTDADGQPYAVDPSRLIIMENGQVIPLDQIEGVGDVGPLTTMLVVDVSDSMNAANKLESSKAAAHQFIDRMRDTDQTGIVAFNTRVDTIQEITSDKEALHAAIDSLTAENETAMYDALNVAISQLEGVEGRKAIILLSDGLDNASSAGEDSVVGNIGPAGFSVSTIGLGEPAQVLDEMSGIDEEGLQSLADRAGGVYGYANDEESLTNLFETYSISMQSEYALTYTSPSQLRDGVNRALSVSLAPIGGGEPVGGEDTRYNPGGLVPEVAQPASWVLFAAIVVGLALLVAVPLLLNNFRSASPASGRANGKTSGSRIRTKPRPKIKLK